MIAHNAEAENNQLAIPRIISTAILMGFNPDGKCIYSEILDVSDYYDGEHIWDNGKTIKAM